MTQITFGSSVHLASLPTPVFRRSWFLTSRTNLATGSRWNPGKHLATSRRFIAHWLLAMLSGLLTLSWMSLLLRLAAFEDVQALMTIVFAPLIGLVGAATGFYFGEKSSEDQ